jgi:hypothetical protein
MSNLTQDATGQRLAELGEAQPHFEFSQVSQPLPSPFSTLRAPKTTSTAQLVFTVAHGRCLPLR